MLDTKLVVACAELAGSADGAVQLLQPACQLHYLVIAEMRKILCQAAPQDAGGGFCDLHAQRSRRRDVAPAVGRIKLASQHTFGFEQLDLPADTGFGLPQTGGNLLLLYARIPLEYHQDPVLA